MMLFIHVRYCTAVPILTHPTSDLSFAKRRRRREDDNWMQNPRTDVTVKLTSMLYVELWTKLRELHTDYYRCIIFPLFEFNDQLIFSCGATRAAQLIVS